jgi:hypothetical protein
MTQRSQIVILCSILLLLGTASPSVQAKWLGKKKKVESQAVEQVRTYQPPPENAVATYCEPYRHEAAELAQKPRLLKPFYAPRRGIAMHKYRECKKALMEEERVYLKHVDIEKSPSLPKLKTETQQAEPPMSGEPTNATGHQ